MSADSGRQNQFVQGPLALSSSKTVIAVEDRLAAQRLHVIVDVAKLSAPPKARGWSALAAGIPARSTVGRHDHTGRKQEAILTMREYVPPGNSIAGDLVD